MAPAQEGFLQANAAKPAGVLVGNGVVLDNGYSVLICRWRERTVKATAGGDTCRYDVKDALLALTKSSTRRVIFMFLDVAAAG